MIRKWTKRICIGLCGILFLITAFLLFLHTPWGRNIVRNKVESFLSETLQTKVSIKDVDYNLLYWLQLKKLVILDQHNDTLFSGGTLYVKIDVLNLLFNRAVIGAAKLEDISIRVRRAAGDSRFNYDFLTKAFTVTADEDTTMSPSKKSAPIKLDIHSILLSNIYFSDSDYHRKQYQTASIKYFQCRPGNLDPEKNFFEIKEIQGHGVYFNLIDSSVSPPDTIKASNKEAIKTTGDSVETTPFLFAFNKLQLKEVYFSYRKPLENFFVESKLDKLATEGVSFDLATQQLHCREFGMDNSGFWLSEFSPPKPSTTTKKNISSTTRKRNWDLAVDTISLRNNVFSYHNQAMKPVTGFDLNHIDVNPINFLGKNIRYDSNGFSSRIDTFSFIVNRRFQLKSLSTEIKYASNQLQAKDFALVYNNSEIRLNGFIPGPGRESPGKSSMCQVENIVVSYKDILELYPQAKTLLPITIVPNDKIRLKGAITGSIENFAVDQIRLSSDQFNFSGNARFENKGDKNGPVFYAVINKLEVKKSLLSSALLKQLKQQNISLPESMVISGTVHGNGNRISSDLRMRSSYGQLAIKGNAANFTEPNRMQYDIHLQAKQLEIGRWISNEKTLGKLDGEINLKGKGTKPALIQARSDLKIRSIVLNGYRYSHIALNSTIDKGHFFAVTKVADPNLLIAVQLTGSIAGSYPVLSGNLSIEKANLKSLGFSPDSMTVSGIIKIDTLNANPSHLLASIKTTNAVLISKGKKIIIDTLSIKGYSEKEGTGLLIDAPFLHSSFSSSYPVDQLAKKMQEAFSQLAQNKVYNKDGGGWFKLSATVSQDAVLTAFVPGLELKQPLHIDGMFNNQRDDSSFQLDVNAPSISYGNIVADSVRINAFNSGDVKTFSVTTTSFTSGTNTMYGVTLDGMFKDSTMELDASIKDKKQIEAYAVKTSIGFKKNEIVVNLPGDLVLNYNTWKVPSNNLLRIRSNGIIAQNFILSNKLKNISVNTPSADSVSPLQVKIDSVDIGQLVSLAGLTDTSTVNGILNVDVVVEQPVKSFPVFTGKAALSQLAFQGKSIGDFEIKSRTQGDSLQLDGKLTGPSEVQLSGSIHPKEKKLRIDANLEKLDLSTLQAFLQDYISRAYGFVKADLHVTGKMDSPMINGTINFDSTGFAIAELNTIYRINNQQIVIDYPTISFTEFVLSDSAGNNLTVDGRVKTGGPKKFELDLRTKTTDFVMLNTKQKPESSIYGKAIINADMRAKGNSDQLAIDGNIFLRESSDVHYVVPRSKTYSKGSKNIRFVDIDTIAAPGVQSVVLRDSLKIPKPLQGFKYNVKLQISKDASFTILIDPATRDELMIQGEAQFNTGVQEDGSLGIAGVYSLQSGYYNMNTQFLKGKFMLTKGSTVTFNGNPYDAIADITMEYEVKTSPSGLLSSSKSDQAGASEKIPFLILLKAKGPLSKPELSFDIRQKNKMGGASNSLQTSIDYELAKLRNDETAMNKQVFSLLVMNQFTVYTNQTNMAESDLNPDVMLRQGMSQFLSDAMNSVADGLIKGVDVNVNLQNYKDESRSSGTRTDLGISLSKDVNERLTVTVGKNIAVGETSQNYAKAADQYIPDITTSYRLSKDGRYYVKAYRKNEYDAVVDGYFAKTGVSFTIQMDFNRFKELFTRSGKLQNP